MKKIGLFYILAAALLMPSGAAFTQGQNLAMLAYKLRMDGDPHAALAFLDSSLLAHPDSARIWFEKGRCMDWIKTEGCRKFTDSWKYLSPRLRVSRRCFNRAIHHDPDNSRYHYWASENASLRGMLGFYSPWKWPAVPFIRAYLRHVDSGYNYYKATGQNVLGQYYQQKGEKDKAKACFAEAGRLNPNNNGSGIDLNPPGS